MNDKVEHVRQAAQTRNHTCHWPGCTQRVPPAMWGCRPHWYALPKSLRLKLWRVYEIGQEDRMDPSDEYIAVAREIQEWIKANHPEQLSL